MKTKKVKSKSRLHQHRLLMAGFFCSALFLASTGYGQISGVYPEGASCIGRNRLNISGSYSTLFPSAGLWLEGPRIGAGIGVGIHENIDLKFSYTRWMVRRSDYNQNAFQFSSKFSSKNKRTAFYLPVAMIYSKEDNYDGEENKETMWAIAPRLICSVARTKGFDFSIIPYAEILFEKEFDSVVTGGLNLGMGFELIPDMVTFRIEAGIDLRCTFSGYPFGTAGFGLYYTIGNDSQAE